MNIILQHWTGDLGALEILSSDNISHYAKQIGAHYELIRGDAFRYGLAPQSQKVVMLDSAFNRYDTVVMIDLDVFTLKGMVGDIFEHEGTGRHGYLQHLLVRKLCSMFPEVGDPKYSYWGGSIYKMDWDLRERLREHLADFDLSMFNDDFHDEGIMHALAVKAEVGGRYFSHDRWNMPSFEPDVDSAYTIHIRPRKMDNGKLVPALKMDVYKDLVERGLIE